MKARMMSSMGARFCGCLHERKHAHAVPLGLEEVQTIPGYHDEPLKGRPKGSTLNSDQPSVSRHLRGALSRKVRAAARREPGKSERYRDATRPSHTLHDQVRDAGLAQQTVGRRAAARNTALKSARPIQKSARRISSPGSRYAKPRSRIDTFASEYACPRSPIVIPSIGTWHPLAPRNGFSRSEHQPTPLGASIPQRQNLIPHLDRCRSPGDSSRGSKGGISRSRGHRSPAARGAKSTARRTSRALIGQRRAR